MVKKMKIAMIIIIILLLVVGGIVGGKYLYDVKTYKDKVASIKINNVDISKKENGEYIGQYDVKFIKANVEVDIRDKKIADIKILEHKNGRGKKAEKIIDSVKNKNSLIVDTVTGATNSSKVILKAIENALEE